jgi:hypothetical protein
VFYHRIGTDAANDLGVCATPALPDQMFGVVVSDDGRFLVLTVSKDCEPSNLVWLVDISSAVAAVASYGDAFADRALLRDKSQQYVGWPRHSMPVNEFGFAFGTLRSLAVNSGFVFDACSRLHHERRRRVLLQDEQRRTKVSRRVDAHRIQRRQRIVSVR